MKYLIFNSLLLLLLLSSCKSDDNNNIRNEVMKWREKVIRFPQRVTYVNFGGDTVQVNDKSQMQILCYTDSIGCSSCKLQLSKWNDLIEEFDSICKGKVQLSYLFYFHPKKLENIQNTLWIYKFFHPICIDRDDSLNKLNHFPNDDRFHTFLLDRNNKVLVVGNPVYNPDIKKLYLQIINGQDITPTIQGVDTKVSVDKLSINMETFDWKKEQNAEFVLTNTGQNLLVINDVITSCGCITVTFDKKPVLFDKKVKFRVRYKAEHPEHFNKKITVYCNAKGSPFQLKVHGNAK